jgi:dUTP pyrophosphatase
LVFKLCYFIKKRVYDLGIKPLKVYLQFNFILELDILILLKRQIMSIKVIYKSKHDLPSCSMPLWTGLDIKTDIDDNINLKRMGSALVKAGLYLELPGRSKTKIKPGIGLTTNKGITLHSSKATLDSHYRVEVCTNPMNLLVENFVVIDIDRVCQIIQKNKKAEWVTVDNFIDTERETGGIVLTGKEK